jgi:argininosuccinate lyase
MTDRGEMPWGGRFSAAPDPEMMRQSMSIDFDIRLLDSDVASTRAHARALVAAGLLEEEALWAIDDVCQALLSQFHLGAVEPEGDEDVHSFVERFLTDQLGETGARIHAGRSRNDLVATDLRLWCRERATRLASTARATIAAICDVASEHLDSVMPGYTHMQRAQPVSLAFHLCAHGFALKRDVSRFEAAARAADSSSLGAGALAGNTLGLDPSIPAAELGFSSTFDNAMDTVSDRDFVVDLVYACAMCGVHLSRLAEEMVLWTSSEFGFARFSDQWSTGSSMMPQKRNPDMAELLRGRSAPTIGDLTALLVLLKGLPLAYDRDLQEDKPIVFAAADRCDDALAAAAHCVAELSFDRDAMATAAASAGTWATDVAEWLVLRGVPFRTAHNAAGRLVASLEERGLPLSGATDDLLTDIHPELTPEVRELDDAYASMKARNSPGGTAPDRVREQIQSLRTDL